MIFIIWGMIIALMIVLNVIEVVRRKKEVVVRVSLGESAGFIAFKVALFDVTFDIALFIVAKYCCQIIYREHMRIDSSQFYIPLELFFPLFHIVLLLF